MTEKGKNRKRNFRFESLQLHAGHTLDIIATRARAVQFIAEYAANVFGGKEVAHVYTRGWLHLKATLPNWGSMSNLFKAMIQKNRRIR
ncbi:uncharacterized protein OCT59_028826 [Rhizophagus irregularis]|uniref:uncharacterized protein n=1 Tax=Rhizophagus irregularis TaxID=588596 RepID=UPI000CC4AA36|nr:hypothetical protein OCT59_028826 [Rhizophagus irregularis]GET50810.1 O-acetylhomoserine/O-acetylserine sulfhydrylase [Rhizophagus irregularis DAOM 181602=DAOM 197198]